MITVHNITYILDIGDWDLMVQRHLIMYSPDVGLRETKEEEEDLRFNKTI